MDLETLSRGLQIFIIGFGGVFLNLVILMGSVKALAWGLSVAEKKATSKKSDGEKKGD